MKDSLITSTMGRTVLSSCVSGVACLRIDDDDEFVVALIVVLTVVCF